MLFFHNYWSKGQFDIVTHKVRLFILASKRFELSILLFEFLIELLKWNPYGPCGREKPCLFACGGVFLLMIGAGGLLAHLKKSRTSYNDGIVVWWSSLVWCPSYNDGRLCWTAGIGSAAIGWIVWFQGPWFPPGGRICWVRLAYHQEGFEAEQLDFKASTPFACFICTLFFKNSIGV